MIDPTSVSTTPRPRERRVARAFALLSVAAAALPADAPAQVVDPATQVPRYARAFEPSVSVTFGASSYGERLRTANGGRRFKPASSFVVGAWGDRPLTRRTGVVAGLSVAPVSARREDQTGDNPQSYTFERIMLATADLGLAGRLKPSAPVFFMIGGGVLASTRGVSRDAAVADERLFEPHADVTIGVDGMRRQRWGWRVLYVNRFAFPGEVESAGYSASSSAHDWTFNVGARRTFGDVPGLGGRRPGTAGGR